MEAIGAVFAWRLWRAVHGRKVTCVVNGSTITYRAMEASGRTARERMFIPFGPREPFAVRFARAVYMRPASAVGLVMVAAISI